MDLQSLFVFDISNEHVQKRVDDSLIVYTQIELNLEYKAERRPGNSTIIVD